MTTTLVRRSPTLRRPYRAQGALRRRPAPLPPPDRLQALLRKYDTPERFSIAVDRLIDDLLKKPLPCRRT